MSVANPLTDELRRRLRDYLPSLSDRPEGADLAQILDDVVSAVDTELAATVGKIETGTLTVTNGGTTGTASTDAADSDPVVATIAEAGSSSTTILSAVISSGTLTVTVDTDPGTDLSVNYMIDKRA